MDKRVQRRRDAIVDLIESSAFPHELKRSFVALTLKYGEESALKEKIIDRLEAQGDLFEPGVHRSELKRLMRAIEGVD